MKMKFNDLDMKSWKDSDINTDSLWVINERDKSGKHKNVYHGNFIPQIPNQLIQRYTKENEIVLEPFMGSGTTLFECEKLHRKYIGFDINPQMLEYVNNSMRDEKYADNFYINDCNSLDSLQVDENVKKANEKFNSSHVQFVLMHPPYMDIVKFTENENDLSQIDDIDEFVNKLNINGEKYCA
ncbi:MAG: DNA methyltransferase [Sulfurimonas sp.]|uniref:DNA methyltransferase n=1 Tax=Sulfurimonas sp. TaxID=2022749 RepID=UPI003564AED0